MSTRCQLAVFESENALNSSAKVLLYRHSDGYPEGILPDIKPFLVKFNKARGIGDTAYCLARLTQHMTNKFDREMKKINKELNRPKKMEVLGFGIDECFHGDIEYFYHISPTAIKVYRVASENPDQWEIVKRVPLPKGSENF